MNSSEAEPRGFAPGTILGERFRIVRAVGHGGMGVVYEAIDQKLDRQVAFKCAKLGHHHRLPPEARAAREVSHFNVCKVHELHSLDTPWGEMECLSMEFIDGETLSDRIRRTGPLAGNEARDIARQICAGLGQAHRQGVIHGDLKCGNVMLARSPEGGVRAVITDFGLAKMKDTRSDEASGGTYDYMAPEQLLGEPATEASDIYALGVLFHVMLTGRAPERIKLLPATIRPESWASGTEGSTVTLGHAIVDADWQRTIEHLPAPWKRVVARCLAARPGQRFRSAEAVAHAFDTRRRVLKWTAAVAAAVGLMAAGREWRNQAEVTPVRLAVLPFSVQGDRMDTAVGIGLEVADRLSGARRRFSVISPREAERNQAATPEQARKTLGATHALQTQVHASGGEISATASLVDLQSGRTLGQLTGTYQAADSPALAKALVATVTEAFRLPAVKETIQGAAYPYYVRGVDLLRQDNAKNADKVIPLFTKAIELDPRSALPYAGLAEAQIQMFDRGDGTKWLDLAEVTVAKAKSINSDSVGVLMVSGLVQQQHGRYEQAIREFTRATELAPGDPDPWRRLAQCYADSNRPDEAVATYQKAIEAQPNYYRNYLTLGTFYLTRGQYERAEEQYRRVVAVAPDLASGHMNLGLALMQQGRFPEAESQLLEALRARESRNLLVNLGALYYEEERFEEAAKYFEKSLTAGTPNALLFRDLGDAYRHLGKAHDADAAYRRGRALAEEEITRNPRRANSHALAGLLAAFLRDPRRAEFELSQALAVEPENRAVIRDAAIAYETMRQRDKALGVLRNAPKRLLEELSRQPDVKDLQKDPRFQDILSGKRTE